MERNPGKKLATKKKKTCLGEDRTVMFSIVYKGSVTNMPTTKLKWVIKEVRKGILKPLYSIGNVRKERILLNHHLKEQDIHSKAEIYDEMN